MHKLEITIQRYRDDYGWPVVVDQEETETLVHSRREGRLRIGGQHLKEDLDDWKKGLARSFLKPEDYGQTLGEALFGDGEARDAFNDAVTRSQARGDNLRVFLVVEDEDLKPLHWERLCARIGPGKAWDFIALDQRFPFSLYIPSLTAHAFPPIGRYELRALVVVANAPPENDYGLAPFDAEAAIEGVTKALTPIDCDILANVNGYPLPTLDEIGKHLTTRYYSLLHIVAHGQFIKHGDADSKGETFIYLAGEEKDQIKDIPATTFLRELSRVQGSRGLPLLTFLGTCESAAPEAEQAGALGGLAQRLVRDLSLPAVIAMTQKVTIATADILAREFYHRLHASGEVDLALVEACVELYKRRDVTVPALYGRLGGRALFRADDRPLTHADIQTGLARLEMLLADDPPDASPGQAETPGRAPVLIPTLKKAAETLETERDALSEEKQAAWNGALAEVSTICEEAVGLNFRALAFGDEPPAYDNRCPFLGLVAFKLDDREFFFGRESLIRSLTGRLKQTSFLPVLGPSGCGKSSLIFAGVLPALQQEMPALHWAYFTPGDSPLTNLETALAELGLPTHQTGLGNSAVPRPTLLIIDQFEELFTLTPRQQRQPFIDRLLELIGLTQDPKGFENPSGLMVVLTIQDSMRHIFVRLTRLGEADDSQPRRDTRQRVGLEELLPSKETPTARRQVRDLIRRLADERLIITGQDEVEVAHEALIRYWPRLQTWLNADAGDLRLRDSIRQAGLDWQEAVKKDADPDSYLIHRGDRLTAADRLTANPRILLSRLDQEYIQACLEQRKREAEEKDEQDRREREALEQAAQADAERARIAEKSANALRKRAFGIAGIGLVAVLFAVAAGIFGVQSRRSEARAEDQRRQAELQAAIARAGELAALAQTELDNDNTDVALMLAREAVLTTWRPIDTAVITTPLVTSQADTALRQVVTQAEQRPWRTTMPWRAGHTARVLSVAFSPDGQQIVSGSEDQTVRVWIADIEELLTLADALIQRDPAIFIGLERARFGFDNFPSRHEQNRGDPQELTALRLEWLDRRTALTAAQLVTKTGEN